MKMAVSKNREEIVMADCNAPKVALCPQCGGEVILRSRRLMVSKELVYFWRHTNNDNLGCEGRRSPSFLTGNWSKNLFFSRV